METPNGISQASWDTSRHALSNGFTEAIGDKLNEVIVLAQYIDALSAYDFKFVSWEDFILAEDKPEGLINRANDWKQDYEGNHLFVVYDPVDDANGFLLMTSNAIELARLTCEYIRDMEPEEGPLSVDKASAEW